jgi:serine phosphatase RsbU (regulator of sigma subunit)
MGQLRNAFRAYAYDHASPAEIMWRLIRHMAEDQMATAVCIAIDTTTQELTYASAGHPPALLRDDESGVVTRLDLAQAPPLGFASPDAIHETRIALPRHSTLIGYTDGVIERRGQVIDEGIERLEKVVGSAARDVSAAELADTVIRDVAEVTAADDDIAVLVMRFLGLGLVAAPAAGTATTPITTPAMQSRM